MNILGYIYEIDRTQTEDTLASMGRCMGKMLKIEIAKELNSQQAQSTILHEFIEAINFHLNLQLEHRTIAALETGIYQVLTSNGVDLSPLEKD
jgi:surfactin synthase thioesterase subunit